MSERLSGQDAAFLAFESPACPMHVGALALLDVPTDAGPGFAEGLRASLAGRLGGIPRFRQRLERRPRPRWVDDPGADPTGQVHLDPITAASDSEAFLDRVGARFAPPLDPRRPLWEAWVLPGLDGGQRVGLLVKAHHAMVDGGSGLAVMARLLEPDPAAPAPGRTGPPVGADGRGARPGSPPEPRGGALRGLLDLAGRLLRPGSRTSLNGPPDPRREIACATLDEAVLRDAARRAGGSVNDALIAVVAGGVRRWAAGDGLDPDALRLRAFCPTDARRPGDTSLGNQLGAWIVDLPTRGETLEARLRAATGATRRARGRGQSRGVELLGRLADLLPALFPRLGMALAGRLRAFNLVVTHVRGPDRRLRLAGAPLRAFTVLAPVFPGQRCSIAAFRYDGRIHVGLTGAWPRPGEARRLAVAIRAAARELPGLDRSAGGPRLAA